MSIAHKVQLVEALFDRLEKEIVVFQAQSQLNCCIGCGACCSTPEIEASPLEFLPWAFHLFLNGEAEKTLDLLEKSTSLSPDDWTVKKNSSCFADLTVILDSQLQSVDIPKTSRHKCYFDTKTDLRFHSFRRDREHSGRQISFIAKI